MDKLFLSLEDAVKVVVNNWGVDEEIASCELEQKCYISNDQYAIGYEDGILDCISDLKARMRKIND